MKGTLGEVWLDSVVGAGAGGGVVVTATIAERIVVVRFKIAGRI